VITSETAACRGMCKLQLFAGRQKPAQTGYFRHTRVKQLFICTTL